MKSHRTNRSSGFSMIELLVVMVILMILASISIPVYLNQRAKAWDANVKSDLHNAAIAQISYRGDFDQYASDEDDLYLRGYNSSELVTVDIKQGGESFCMEGFHHGKPLTTWNVRSGDGQPNPSEGEC